MSEKLARSAIAAALKGDWETAVRHNLKLLEFNDQDVAALMRTAKAYFELGEVKNAQKYARAVLVVVPNHQIALKALLNWSQAKQPLRNRGITYLSSMFIEQPGKTKLVTLIHLGDTRVIASVNCGSQAKLVTGGRRISVTSESGGYIGRLPDDLSARMVGLIEKGNTYKAFVKSASVREVKVFIRETKRARTLAHVDSFPSDYQVYSPLLGKP